MLCTQVPLEESLNRAKVLHRLWNLRDHRVVIVSVLPNGTRCCLVQDSENDRPLLGHNFVCPLAYGCWCAFRWQDWHTCFWLPPVRFPTRLRKRPNPFQRSSPWLNLICDRK